MAVAAGTNTLAAERRQTLFPTWSSNHRAHLAGLQKASFRLCQNTTEKRNREIRNKYNRATEKRGYLKFETTRKRVKRES